jgi:serine/threonine protein kinase
MHFLTIPSLSPSYPSPIVRCADTIKSCLGFGGFGGVYLATDLTSHEDVVLKAIPCSAVQFTDDVPSEFRIAKKLSDLNRTRFVEMKSWFRDGEFIYLVMEYCRNGTLLKLVEEKKRSCGHFDESVCCSFDPDFESPLFLTT